MHETVAPAPAAADATCVGVCARKSMRCSSSLGIGDEARLSMEFKDYYATLGVSKTATDATSSRPTASWRASTIRT